uniref:Uncharacterized protein n=1 Tax=Aegilops tauschii subsp. strangulata TaxID=200361 RepID=A0A453P3T6_AEGTS
MSWQNQFNQMQNCYPLWNLAIGWEAKYLVPPIDQLYYHSLKPLLFCNCYCYLLVPIC